MPSFRERQGGKAKETRAGETGQATAHTCCAESRGVPRLPPTRVRRGTRAGRHAAAHFSKSENACARCLLLLGCSNFSREWSKKKNSREFKPDSGLSRRVRCRAARSTRDRRSPLCCRGVKNIWSGVRQPWPWLEAHVSTRQAELVWGLVGARAVHQRGGLAPATPGYPRRLWSISSVQFAIVLRFSSQSTYCKKKGAFRSCLY